MRCLENVYGSSMIFSMGLLLDSCGVPWQFYDISLGLLLDFYGMPIVFLWYSYGDSKGCLWDLHWNPMGFPRCFYDISWGFLCDF